MHSYPIPSGMQTELFIVDSGAIKAVPEVLAKFWPNSTPWIIADDNTWAAAGEQLQKMLTKTHPAHIFPGSPLLHPDSDYSEQLAAIMPKDAVPVAVGSGVINDLVKRAAEIVKINYLCVPTAASVDGYTSANAALVVKGRKITQPAAAPKAIVADSDILATAPADMLASGYADLTAKIPAGADWLIADCLNEELINTKVWSMIQPPLRGWLKDPNDLAAVFAGLAATGFAMQVYNDSRPASGADHMFSHIWEMEGLTLDGKSFSHGFQVAVGSLISTRLQEFFCNTSVEQAKSLAKPGLTQSEREAEIAELLAPGCYGSGTEQTALSKFRCGQELLKRRELIYSKWGELQTRIKNQIFTFAELSQKLQNAGSPTSPAVIGVDNKRLIMTIRRAQLIRKRYTILDLLYETGLLDTCLQNIYWG